jgi:hypothetical protein
MMEQKLTVTSMPHAYVAEDASKVEMVFADPTGNTLRLLFESDLFDAFSNRAIQLFTHIRSKKLAMGGHLSVQPVEVVRAAAATTVGGAKVILSLMAENGVPFHFALEPDESRQLRPQMRSAEEKARRQRGQTRQ